MKNRFLMLFQMPNLLRRVSSVMMVACLLSLMPGVHAKGIKGTKFQVPIAKGVEVFEKQVRSKPELPIGERKVLVAKNGQSQVRSRSEVVREVKRRYNAEVLKVTLNKSRTAYKVRILMPNGRVREISVSARK